MSKIKPYCSPRMLAMLRKIAEGVDSASKPASADAAARIALRSRGWIGRDGAVTDEGRAFLKMREGVK